jgi:hypothetical protein
LLKSLELINSLPAEFSEITDSLFTYRNRSLHMGYDWPLNRRLKFHKLLKEKGWDDEWFSVVLSEGAGANGDFSPLLFAMTEKFIGRCISLAKECVTTFYDIKKEKLGNPDGRLDPILKSLLLKRW